MTEATLQEITDSNFIPVYAAINTAYHEVFKGRLIGVYGIGSAVRGAFREGISDVDSVAVIEGGQPTRLENEHLSALRNSIQGRGATGIEMIVMTREEADRDPQFQFLLVNDSVLLSGGGYEVKREFPLPGPELAKLINKGFGEAGVRVSFRLLSTHESKRAILEEKLAKDGLRIIMGLVMAKEPFYTRNMGEVAERALLVLPELEALILKVQGHYLNPTGTSHRVDALIALCEELAEKAKIAGILD